MGKFKSWKHRNLFTNIATSTCLIGASAGLVFGVSAGTFKINYMNLNNSKSRADAANSNYNYYSQKVFSQWNMDKSINPNSKVITPEWWSANHGGKDPLFTEESKKKMQLDIEYGSSTPISKEAMAARYKFCTMIIDGSTHSTMDRSFNQGLYNGLVDFIQNKDILSNDLQPETEVDPSNNCAKSYKPGGDNDTEFVNLYNAVAKTSKVICLAGFNHVTPLNKLGHYNNSTHLVDYTNPDINGVGFLLIDGAVANNQAVGSVLFRADQPGFLTGIATCMFFMNNLSIYHDKHQDLSCGLYGGTSIPTVTAYMGGFQRGIEFFNHFSLAEGMINTELRKIIMEKKTWEETGYKDLHMLYEYSKHKEDIDKLIAKADVTEDQFNDIAQRFYDEYSVKTIKLGSGETHFSGTFAAGDAIGITKQYLNRGASAIIAVAGPQSLDTAQEIQNQNSKCIVIGVDSAMEDGDYQRAYKNGIVDQTTAPDGSKSSQSDKIIKFSAIKDITTVTQKFNNLCASGLNFDIPSTIPGQEGQPDEDRAVCGLGYQTCGNIQNGLISISWDGWYPFVQAMNHVYDYRIMDDHGMYSDPMTFDQVWKHFAEQYIVDHGSELSETFKEKVVDINNLMTYDRNVFDGEIYKNYNKLMLILGNLLNRTSLLFTPDMTVRREQLQDEKGEWHDVYFEETQEHRANILYWLALNMYFNS